MQFVDLNAQHAEVQPELDAAIARVIRESAFIRGPDVDAFEAGFASLMGIRHCVSCANGTDALYIALRSLGAGPGDEVVTTAHSWISTSETITQTGARVVFADTEDGYFTLDPADLERKITAKTKGVIVVHLYGQAADMDGIRDVCRRHDLWLIEDCAQAHLATYKGETIGTMGDIATFSFYPGKNLGAMGDAGCVATNRDDLAEFATLFARHGGKGDHKIEGICSRMDGLQAAVLNVKMSRLPDWNTARRAAAARYHQHLAGLDGLTLPPERPETRHVYHLYVIRTDQRDRLRTHLQSQAIPTGVHYDRALPFYSAYDYLGHQPADFPNAHAHADTILSLPLHPHLTEDEQATVCDAIRAFFG
ncbi:MAG: DegT/DnrJ/EryC1/StrS family aminotransferase [Pseudomonadota bacterium]